MNEVYYGTAVLLGYPIDWDTDPVIRFVEDTEVDDDPSGNEDRHTYLHHFRQQQSWKLACDEIDARLRAEKTLRIAEQEKLCAAPSWLEMREILSADGFCAVMHSDADEAWHAGQHLWYGMPDGTFGIVRIKSIVGRFVEIFDDGVSFTKNMQIAPILIGAIDGDVSWRSDTVEDRDYTIVLTEQGGNENGLIRKVVEYLTLHLETTAESGIRHLDPETINLELNMNSIMETLAVCQEDPNATELSLDFNATLETIVQHRTSTETASLGLDFDATLETVA